MKLFLRYLRSHRRMLILLAVFWCLFAVSFLLYHLPLEAAMYPMFLCLGIGLVACGLDFARVKRAHETLRRIETITDAMTELLPAPDTVQDRDYQEILRLLCRRHEQYRQQTCREYTDMVEYYTVWAHQIKTPIASMRLRLFSFANIHLMIGVTVAGFCAFAVIYACVYKITSNACYTIVSGQQEDA